MQLLRSLTQRRLENSRHRLLYDAVQIKRFGTPPITAEFMEADYREGGRLSKKRQLQKVLKKTLAPKRKPIEVVVETRSTKWDATPGTKLQFTALCLAEFSEAETKHLFERLKNRENDTQIKRSEVELPVNKLVTELDNIMYKSEASRAQKAKLATSLVHDLFLKKPIARWSSKFQRESKVEKKEEFYETLTYEEFREQINRLASKVDKSVSTLTFTFLAMGTSVGLVVPILPQISNQLELSPSQYGSIIAAFALAKVGFNLPAAKLVEKFGRKKVIISGISVLALSNLQLGYCMHALPSYEAILFSRCLTGLGVSFFSSAATVFLSDISTSRNRAKTIAPPVTAFSLGAAIGPAIGGFLVSNFSIPLTFAIATGSFGLVTLIAQKKLKEPFIPDYRLAEKAIKNTNASTENSAEIPFYKNKDVISVIGLNCLYWYVLSGTQMTILPLILSDPMGMNLTSQGLGYMYASMSLVGVLGTPLAGKVIDKFTPMRTIVPASAIVSTGIIYASCNQDLNHFVPAVLFWVLSGTFLGSGPTTYIANNVPIKQRTQSLAWLRIAGDMGLLTGSLTAGFLADVYGKSDAMLGNGIFLLGMTGLTAYRVRHNFRKKKID